MAEADRHVTNPVEAQFCRGGGDTHRADNDDANRDDRDNDHQARRNAREVEGQPRTTSDDKMAKYALGKVDRTGGAAERRRHDETEDIHDAGYQGLKDVVPTSGSVGVRRDRVRNEAHREEDRRYPNVHGQQGNHEPAALAKFHESRHDHRARRYRRAAIVLRRGGDGEVGGRGHCGAPSRVVTSRNHDSREA